MLSSGQQWSLHWWPWQIHLLSWPQELYRMSIKCRIFCEGKLSYTLIDWLCENDGTTTDTLELLKFVDKFWKLKNLVRGIKNRAPHSHCHWWAACSTTTTSQVKHACMHTIQWITVLESRSKKLIFTVSTERLETNSGLYTVVKAYMVVCLHVRSL